MVQNWAKSKLFQLYKIGGAECNSDILDTAASGGGRFEAEVKTKAWFLSTYHEVNLWKVWRRLSKLLKIYGRFCCGENFAYEPCKYKM